MVISNYKAAILNRFKDHTVHSAYDAGGGSVLFVLERKDKKPEVDNVFIVDRNFNVKGYSIVKNSKEFASILKRPIKIGD